MIKILYILTSLNMGGGETLTVNIIEKLDKTKYDIRVLTYSEAKTDVLTKRLEAMNVPVTIIQRKFKFDIGVFGRIARFIKDFAPDVVHSHLATLTYALYGVRKAHVKTVIDTTHSVATHEYPRKIHVRTYYAAFHKYGVIPVAIGSVVKDSMKKIFKLKDEDIETIVNGIDISRFKAKDEYNSNKNLVTVARLEPIKNQILSIRAMRKVVDCDNSVKLFLYGSGSCEQVLKDEILKLGLANNVFLCGLTDNVPSVLIKNDIYLSTSKVEGLPLGFVEAMAVGLPIICTKVGGSVDVVRDNENGILVDSFSESSIAEAILSLSGDIKRCKQISANNINRAPEFDIDRMVEQYEALYNRNL